MSRRIGRFSATPFGGIDGMSDAPREVTMYVSPVEPAACSRGTAAGRLADRAVTRGPRLTAGHA